LVPVDLLLEHFFVTLTPQAAELVKLFELVVVDLDFAIDAPASLSLAHSIELVLLRALVAATATAQVTMSLFHKESEWLEAQLAVWFVLRSFNAVRCQNVGVDRIWRRIVLLLVKKGFLALTERRVLKVCAFAFLLSDFLHFID